MYKFVKKSWDFSNEELDRGWIIVGLKNVGVEVSSRIVGEQGLKEVIKDSGNKVLQK